MFIKIELILRQTFFLCQDGQTYVESCILPIFSKYKNQSQ